MTFPSQPPATSGADRTPRLVYAADGGAWHIPPSDARLRPSGPPASRIVHAAQTLAGLLAWALRLAP